MIPLVKSTFYNERYTKKKLGEYLKIAPKLSFGEECELFEERFAKWQGRKYCVFLNSGSSANLAIIQSLLNLGKLKKGDKVGFSALTWSTNVMPLIQLGLVPVPIDVELDTLNVSSKILEKAVKKEKIKALFITHLLGFCDDIDKVKLLCKKNEILLLEDTCEALGSIYKGRKLGNFGLVSSFSFYVGHHMSTIEGGAVCTDNEELANMLRVVRAHGWDRNLSQDKQLKIRTKHKVNSSFYSRYTFYDLGYNLRPTEIAGFIGNLQLNFIEEIINKREENFISFAREFNNCSDFFSIKYTHMDKISNFAYPLICRSKAIRNSVVNKCTDKVEIRPIVGGDITQQPFFKKYFPSTSTKESNAYLVHEQGLYFSTSPELTSNEIKAIKSTILSSDILLK